jgi:hypothetical protein
MKINKELVLGLLFLSALLLCLLVALATGMA